MVLIPVGDIHSRVGLVGPIQLKIFCDSGQCEGRTWAEGWHVLHGHSGTIKPHRQAGHGSICPTQVSVEKPKMGNFLLSYDSFEVRVLCLDQQCCCGAAWPPQCGGAGSRGAWRHSQATATGASWRERMDVGVECQLERTPMTAQRDCEQRRAGQGRGIGCLDESPGWHKEQCRDSVRCQGLRELRHQLELLPAPAILRGDHTLLTVELQVLWSLMRKIWLPWALDAVTEGERKMSLLGKVFLQPNVWHHLCDKMNHISSCCYGLRSLFNENVMLN